jgi:hypothetical protein
MWAGELAAVWAVSRAAMSVAEWAVSRAAMSAAEKAVSLVGCLGDLLVDHSAAQTDASMVAR